MSEEIREQVTAILQAAGVAYVAHYVGETKREEWQCDEWRIRFSRNTPGFEHSYTGGANKAESFDYFTGLGLRKPDESPMAKMSARSLAKVSKRMLAWEQHYKQFPDKPQGPYPADVLHSLILDSSAAHQSFGDWCADFGYDTDSRKALATYEACQQNADKLRLVFTSEQIAALAEALRDY